LELLNNFLENFLEISLEASPWLLFGLLAAGLIKVWVPESFMKRVLGGRGGWPVVKAALIGAPLPLCSCGVLPAAIGLRRAGASRAATLSFLIATPETGVDSIGISYVLLGPFMTVVRVLAAIFSAILTGLFAALVLSRKGAEKVASVMSANDQQSKVSCCSASCSSEPEPATDESSCCSSDSCSSDGDNIISQSFWSRNIAGLKYAISDIWDDIVLWLLFGLVLASLIATFIPEQALLDWGSGLPAMLVMLFVGIPMYICATASTPLAAGLLLAGISPGTVLVLLLAGPATNMATIAIINKEMGKVVMLVYLLGISISSVAFGLLTDFVVGSYQIDINAQIQGAAEIVPQWIAVFSVLLLFVSAIKPLRKRLLAC